MYYDFLKNKKVAFIGPAPYMQGLKQAKKIDSYDVVVRPCCCYRVPEKFKDDWGSKINIWYASFTSFIFNGYISEDIVKNLSSRGLKWFCLSGGPIVKKNSDKLKYYSKKYKISIRTLDNTIRGSVHEKVFSGVNKKSRKGLTTGIISIYDLLQSDLKELYVAGITFYKLWPPDKKKMYYSGYRKEKKYYYSKRPLKGHDTKRELLFFKKMVEDDKRIKCDDVLYKIIGVGKNGKAYNNERD